MPGRDPDPCHKQRRKPPAVTPTAASRVPTLDKPQGPAIQRSIPSGKVERSKGDPEPSGSIIPGKTCPKFKPRKRGPVRKFNRNNAVCPSTLQNRRPFQHTAAAGHINMLDVKPDILEQSDACGVLILDTSDQRFL